MLIEDIANAPTGKYLASDVCLEIRIKVFSAFACFGGTSLGGVIFPMKRCPSPLIVRLRQRFRCKVLLLEHRRKCGEWGGSGRKGEDCRKRKEKRRWKGGEEGNMVAA